jgi:DNA helicase II / ATP-dependent DNA helicase PcrA
MAQLNATISAALGRLTDEQHLAATTPGDVCVVAGAGTGKTTTMCARVAVAVSTGRVDPARVLAVTHSRRAAGEMRERILSLGVDGPRVRTFHSAAWAQLTAADGRPPVLLESPHRLIRHLLGPAASTSSRGEDCVVDVVSEISWAQTSLLTPDRYPGAATAAGRSAPLSFEHIAELWRRYQEAKRVQGVEDFSDVLVRAGQTPFAGHWDLVVVDEYQDTDPAQQQLFELWAGSNAEKSVVGDSRQAIYGFKAGSPRFLDEFATAAGVTVVHLTRNFRSTVEICTAANRLHPQMPALTGSGSGGPVRTESAADEDGEERRVVSALLRWQAAGIPFEEMALLARFRSVTARFEVALNRAGIPYNTGSDEKFFDQPDVKSVLQEFARRAKLEPDEPGAAVLRGIAEAFGWVRAEPPAGEGARRRRWEFHTALVEMVERIPSVETLASRWLLDELVTRFRESHVPTPRGVSLLTVHGAKGMEWDAVAVVGASDGAFPSSYAVTAAQHREELNLFYVALTRARREVLVTYPLSRNNRRTRASRFIELLGLHPQTTTAHTGAVAQTVSPEQTGLGRCRTCSTRLVGAGARKLGVCVAHLSGAAAALAAEVHRWRDAEAARLELDPATVCPDAALLWLVTAGPVGVAELRGAPRLRSTDTDLVSLAALLASHSSS